MILKPHILFNSCVKNDEVDKHYFYVKHRRFLPIYAVVFCLPVVRVAQLVSALLSVLEVPSSILSTSNVCSDFPLICVAFISFKYWEY